MSIAREILLKAARAGAWSYGSSSLGVPKHKDYRRACWKYSEWRNAFAERMIREIRS
jgi:hypothetical protein